MVLLTRGFPVLLEIGLLVYCLLDVIQTSDDEVRNLPRWGWMVLIVVIPVAGGIAWLVAGRPRAPRSGGSPWPVPPRSHPAHGRRPPRALGPDDDPEFLAQLRAIDQEHERTLAQWEADLRRREARLRSEDDGARPEASGRREEEPGEDASPTV